MMAHSVYPPIAAACALLCAVDALRLARPEEALLSRGLPAGKDGPKIFRSAWENKTSLDEQSGHYLTRALPDSIRLVLGVMTVPAEEPYRAVVRDTWMRYPFVCGFELAPHPKCQIHAGFVFGNATNASNESTLRNGDLHLYVPGCKYSLGVDLTRKNFIFFQYAVRAFPWATHIARIDIDFFPHVRPMLEYLQRFDAQGLPMQYLGRPVTKGWGMCGADMLDVVTARDQVRNVCVEGPFIALSRPLALALTENFNDYIEPTFRQHSRLPEDITFAMVVGDFVRKTRTHVTADDQTQFPPVDPPFWDHARWPRYRAGVDDAPPP